MATLNEYRPPMPAWAMVQVDTLRERPGHVLRVGVHTPTGFVVLLGIPLRESVDRAHCVAGDARSLLQQVIEQATVQLATMELERN